MRRRFISILLFTLFLVFSISGFANAATVLKTGSRGSQVAEMQQRLISLGYLSGKADGIFGPVTASAVKSFQKAHGLTVDGIAGPATLGVLYSASAKPAGSSSSPGGSSGGTQPPSGGNTGAAPIQRVLRRGDRGSDVAALQSRLNELKYNAGAADGIFGTATENAVRAFQRDKGLTVDGIVGSKTVAALYSGSAAPPAGNPGTQNPPSSGGSPANPITTILKKGSKGSQVQALQIRLNELGFHCGTPDGIFGQNTYNAVVAFQRANSLTADGIVGPATASRLFPQQSGSSPDPSPSPTPTPDPPHENPVPDSLKGKIVIIDPGHGGVDSGAYHGGLKEAELALDMGLRLRNLLEQAGATVYMTRSDNRYVSLYYRSAFANKIVLDLEIQSVMEQKEQAQKDAADKQSEIDLLDSDKMLLAAYEEALIQLRDVYVNQHAASAEGLEGETHEAPNASEELLVKLAQAEGLRSNLRQRWKDWIYLGNEALTPDHLADLDQRIASVAQALLQADMEASQLQQEIIALHNAIFDYDSSVAELQRLLNGFQPYFDNPSLNSRTAIYSAINNGIQNIASDDLKKVMDLARKYENKIVFVSIHLNATNESQTTASGFYTFYRDNKPDSANNAQYYSNYNSAARASFASLLLQEVNKTTNFSKKQSAPHIADFSVLRENNIVSSLVEVGFMNNPDDLSLVAQPSFRENVAYGIYRGIAEYFK